ncbi:hypothetical protein [Nostoc sp. CALU 546]
MLNDESCDTYGGLRQRLYSIKTCTKAAILIPQKHREISGTVT